MTVLRAARDAAVLSGIPSTAWALRRGRDPLEATKAAGRIVLPDTTRTVPLLIAGAGVHAALSLGWTVVVARTLPRDAGRAQTALHGALMGGAIAALDLGLARVVRHPRLRAIRELPLGPQVADHVAFGVIAAVRAAS